MHQTARGAHAVRMAPRVARLVRLRSVPLAQGAACHMLHAPTLYMARPKLRFRGPLLHPLTSPRCFWAFQPKVEIPSSCRRWPCRRLHMQRSAPPPAFVPHALRSLPEGVGRGYAALPREGRVCARGMPRAVSKPATCTASTPLRGRVLACFSGPPFSTKTGGVLRDQMQWTFYRTGGGGWGD